MPIALLTLVAGIFALVLVAGHLGLRGMALLLGLCVVVFFGLLGVRSVQLEHRTERAPAAAIVAKPKVTTEQMWEELNQSKILLATGSTVDVSDQAAVMKKVRLHDDASGQAVAASDEAKRPAWVDATHKRVGNVRRQVVVSDPYDTVEACYRALQRYKLQDAVRDRLDEIAPVRYGASLEALGLGPDFVWREVCHDEWVETLDTSVGEMKRVHALLEFDASVDRQLTEAARNYARQYRIEEVGSVAGLGLGSLALLFGLLKVDTWTKGYYTKRLFFGVPAVIIAFIALIN